MSTDEWRDLAALLVETDLAIEDLNGWATRQEDVDELRRLETLRDEIQDALASRHLSRRLRRRVAQGSHRVRGSPRVDPRD